MAIDKQWIVSLKGRDYPLWAGILDAATQAGLRSLKTTVLQVPCPENGNLAVVMAIAEFEDGRVFQDIGDCSPASTSPQLAAASLRLASTRAKGRVLRDAINVGQTMFEELPDLDDDRSQKAATPRQEQREERAAAPEGLTCECGAPLTPAQATFSAKKFAGRTLCLVCQKKEESR